MLLKLFYIFNTFFREFVIVNSNFLCIVFHCTYIGTLTRLRSFKYLAGCCIRKKEENMNRLEYFLFELHKKFHWIHSNEHLTLSKMEE